MTSTVSSITPARLKFTSAEYVKEFDSLCSLFVAVYTYSDRWLQLLSLAPTKYA